MKQAQFTNVASVALLGRPAGSTFFLEVIDDGETPAEVYWRKRIAEGVAQLATPNASPVASDEAKTAKKGK